MNARPFQPRRQPGPLNRENRFTARRQLSIVVRDKRCRAEPPRQRRPPFRQRKRDHPEIALPRHVGPPRPPPLIQDQLQIELADRESGAERFAFREDLAVFGDKILAREDRVRRRLSESCFRGDISGLKPRRDRAKERTPRPCLSDDLGTGGAIRKNRRARRRGRNRRRDRKLRIVADFDPDRQRRQLDATESRSVPNGTSSPRILAVPPIPCPEAKTSPFPEIQLFGTTPEILPFATAAATL